MRQSARTRGSDNSFGFGRWPNIDALELATLVLDLGSFRKAAEVLSIEPSTVSRHIREIEDAVGVSLFQRHTRGAQPTQAGLRLLPRFRRVTDELRLILGSGALLGRGSEGELVLGVVASIAGGGSRTLLAGFLAEQAAIDLTIIEGSPRNHAGEVRELRLDAAIVVGRPPAPGCVVEPLWSESIMVALPTAHCLAQTEVIAWRDLSNERFLVSRADPGPEIQDYIVQHLASLGHRPIVEPRMVGREALLGMIGLGLGISLVSGAEAAVTYPGVVFRPLDDHPLPHAIIWSERNDNPILRRFICYARQWSKARATEGLSLNGAPAQTPDPSP